MQSVRNAISHGYLKMSSHGVLKRVPQWIGQHILLTSFWFVILNPCISWSENVRLQREQHPAQNDGTVDNVVPSSNNTEGQLVTNTYTETSASHTICSTSRQPLSSIPPSSSQAVQVCVGNVVLTLSVFLTVSHLAWYIMFVFTNILYSSASHIQSCALERIFTVYSSDTF